MYSGEYDSVLHRLHGYSLVLKRKVPWLLGGTLEWWFFCFKKKTKKPKAKLMKRTGGNKLLKKVCTGHRLHFVFGEKHSKEKIDCNKHYLKLFWNLQLSSPFLQRFKWQGFAKQSSQSLQKASGFVYIFTSAKKMTDGDQMYNLKVKSSSLFPLLLSPLDAPFYSFLSSPIHCLAASSHSNAKLHRAPAELQPGLFWRPEHFSLEKQ